MFDSDNQPSTSSWPCLTLIRHLWQEINDISTQWHLLLHIIESRIGRSQFTSIYKKHLLALYNVFWSRRLTFHFTVLICNSDSERNYLKLDFIKKTQRNDSESDFVLEQWRCLHQVVTMTNIWLVSDPPHNQIRLPRLCTEQSLIWRWRCKL